MAEIIRPVAVTDATYTDTDLTDATATWSAGSYSTGTVRGYAHHRWESLVDTNTETPGVDPDKWLDLGPDNIWALFDGAVNSQSARAVGFEVEITDPDHPIDMVLLQNLSATEVEGTLTDSIEGVVWNETISLDATAAIDNWLSYFAEPFRFDTEALFADIPSLYVGAALRIAVRNPDGVAGCGLCVPGLSLNMGGTQWGVETGIDDYSRKETNAWGDVVVQEGAFNKRARYSIWAARDRVGFLQDTMAGFRAQPLAVIGSRADRASWVYGFIASFNFVLSFPSMANFDLQMKGLV